MAPLSAHLTSKLQKEFYTFDISLMDIEYPQGLSSPPLLFREARMISGQTFSGQVHYGRGVQHDPVSMISTNIKAVILFPSEQ